MRSASQRRMISAAILRWYRFNGRELPWRGIRNPYRILVSEIMLQQTQVSRVLEKYPVFLKTFPTLSSLAAAPRALVIRTWEGMGYNNRAVRLHVLAQRVQVHHKGSLPRTYEALRELPGIGQYTARAILSSAFGMAEPVVDINIRRFFSRLFWRMPNAAVLRPDREIWDLAASLLPYGAAYDWNQALMDLGAMVCTARAPRCSACPVVRWCQSRTSLRRAGSSGITRMVDSENSPGQMKSASRTTQMRLGKRTDVETIRSAKREPSYRGIPVRLHRGRVVQVLRQVPEGSYISTKPLVRSLFVDSSHEDVHWLSELLTALERDGLVERKGNLVRLKE